MRITKISLKPGSVLLPASVWWRFRHDGTFWYFWNKNLYYNYLM